MSHNIAIDGPAGAGKSTIAKLVAKKLKFVYVDTGAMYRGIGIAATRENMSELSGEALEALCDRHKIGIEYVNGTQVVLLDGENINPILRTEEAGKMASAVSAFPLVRQKMVAMQQELASHTDVVMDGRDIGTVVLPDAELKIYLTASVHTRALRRYRELEGKGEVCDMAVIEADIEKRDYDDMHRAASPLRRADDAYLLDSSDLTIEEVTDRILSLYREKVK